MNKFFESVSSNVVANIVTSIVLAALGILLLFFSGLPITLRLLIAGLMLVIMCGLVYLFRTRLQLQTPYPAWMLIEAVLGTITIVLVIIGFILFLGVTPHPNDLTSYISLNLVDDDKDSTDFGWVSGNDGQQEQPALTEAELDSISGQFVRYPVNLTSTQDATGYSVGNQLAQLQRKLRNIERGKWDTLLTTMYIQSEEDREIFVTTYLRIPGQEIIYLGFGQTIRTNEWSTLIWREHAQSMVWRQDFYDALEAVRDEYGLADVGHIRLSHILTIEKKDGTYLGFELRLISQEPVGRADSIDAEIFISSVTFLQ